VRAPEISGCLLRLPLDTPSGGGPAHHHIHHPFDYFYYMKMLFWIKNARGTYQWSVQFRFKGQIGHNLEVYVDDIVIKSRRSDSLIVDLEETFNILRWFNIKLNT
jgi:hypothetical protein